MLASRDLSVVVLVEIENQLLDFEAELEVEEDGWIVRRNVENDVLPHASLELMFLLLV